MIYGQLQYYNAELNAWLRSIDFHKRELNELLTLLNVLLNFPLVSLPDSKAGNAFIDQLMVQEQQFDHVRQHFDQQAQRLKNAIISADKLESSTLTIQQNCRMKMKTYELAFVKTKYNCSIFLAGFFQPDQMAVQVK